VRNANPLIRNGSRSVPLGSLEERLQILQQAVLDFIAAGGRASIADLRPRRQDVAIVLQEIGFCKEHGDLFSGMCQKCRMSDAVSGNALVSANVPETARNPLPEISGNLLND